MCILRHLAQPKSPQSLMQLWRLFIRSGTKNLLRGSLRSKRDTLTASWPTGVPVCSYTSPNSLPTAGLAMSSWHPLWLAPSKADADRAIAALDAANQLVSESRRPIVTQREGDFLSGMEGFFLRDSELPYTQRVHSYEAQMRQLYLRYCLFLSFFT